MTALGARSRWVLGDVEAQRRYILSRRANSSMGLRVELDAANKILLLHFDGQWSDETVAQFYRAIRNHWIAANAPMGIGDFSAATAFALSSELIRQLAQRNHACRIQQVARA